MEKPKTIKRIIMILLTLVFLSILSILLVFCINACAKSKWQQRVWQERTLALVDQAYQVTDKDKGAFGELPSLEMAKTPDLYTTAWNLQLLQLLGEINKNTPHAKKTIAWLEGLAASPQKLFEEGTPFPSLYKIYLLVKCFEALDVDSQNRNKLIELVLKHQDSQTGLFRLTLDIPAGEQYDYSATALALEILKDLQFDFKQAMKTNLNFTNLHASLREAFQDDLNFREPEDFGTNGAGVIMSLWYLGANPEQFPKDLVARRKAMLNSIEASAFSVQDFGAYKLSLSEILIKSKAFFKEHVEKNEDYLRLVKESQISNGGFPAFKEAYAFEPHVTYQTLFLLKHWSEPTPRRDALVHVIATHRSPRGGWQAVRISTPNPRATFYALAINQRLKDKSYKNAVAVHNQIIAWIEMWSQRFPTWSPVEQLFSFEDLRFLLLSAELLKIKVNQKKLSTTLKTFKSKEALVQSPQFGNPLSPWAAYADICLRTKEDIPSKVKAGLIEKVNEIGENGYGWKGLTFIKEIKDAVSLLRIISPKELEKQKQTIISLVDSARTPEGGFKFAVRNPYAKEECPSELPANPDLISTWYAVQIYRDLKLRPQSPASLRNFLKEQAHDEGGFLLLNKKRKNNDLTLETTFAGLEIVGFLEAEAALGL